jgi:hypothetical protein
MENKNRCDRCSEIRSFFKILFKEDKNNNKMISEKVCYDCLNKYNPGRSWRQYSNPGNKEKT